MKKVFYSLCALALTMGFTSCGDKTVAAGEANAEDVALGDSISVAYGEFLAARAYGDIERQIQSLPEDMRDQFSRAEFMRGVKAVATRDTSNLAYIMGVNYGTQIWAGSRGIPADLKVPVNTGKILSAFEKIANADSVGDVYMYQSQFQMLMSRAQERITERRNAELAASPESQANLAAGKAYADSLVNAGYTRAESGLVYKIENPGTGDLVKANDRIKLRYVGKHLDGSVFDQTREEPMTSYAGRFIPGFTEGLQLLGKGGKATLVIPGELAYGVNGQGGIGVNETLVFDIEIVDIVK